MPDEGRSVASGWSRSTRIPDEGNFVGSGGNFCGRAVPDSWGSFAVVSLALCGSPVSGPGMSA